MKRIPKKIPAIYSCFILILFQVDSQKEQRESRVETVTKVPERGDTKEPEKSNAKSLYFVSISFITGYSDYCIFFLFLQ